MTRHAATWQIRNGLKPRFLIEAIAIFDHGIFVLSLVSDLAIVSKSWLLIHGLERCGLQSVNDVSARNVWREQWYLNGIQ